MSYATPTQVQELMARLNANAAFSASSVPTLTQVTDIIAGISSEIDLHLSSIGYSVPVTSPSAFVTALAEFNAWGAAAIVLKSAFPESQMSTGGGPVIPAYSFYEKKYQDALTDIDKRIIVSPTAAMANDSLARSYLQDNPDNAGADGSDGFVGDGWGVGQQPSFSNQRTW